MMFAVQRSGWGIMLLAMLASGVALAAGTGTYKWVDDQGNVHYTDHMPPEAMNKGSTILDKSGRPIKKIDPATPADQIKAKQDEEARQQSLARDQEVQARRDRALLASFTNEDEIDLARNRAMATIDTQLKSAESYSTTLARHQQELENKKLEYGSKPIPSALERELAANGDELVRQNKLIGQKKEELSTIVARYDAEKRRWMELKSQGYAVPPPPSEKGPGPGAKPVAGSPTAAR